VCVCSSDSDSGFAYAGEAVEGLLSDVILRCVGFFRFCSNITSHFTSTELAYYRPLSDHAHMRLGLSRVLALICMASPLSRAFQSASARAGSGVGRTRARRLSAAAAPSAGDRRLADLRRSDTFSVAPMMDYTDRHLRFLLRLISNRVKLYSEMITANALIHGNDVHRFLLYNPEEHPVVLQLGGNTPESLAAAVRMALPYGYDEINLNCGCPSEAVRVIVAPLLVATCCSTLVAWESMPAHRSRASLPITSRACVRWRATAASARH